MMNTPSPSLLLTYGSLPTSVRSTEPIHQFCHRLKTHLFTQSFGWSHRVTPAALPTHGAQYELWRGLQMHWLIDWSIDRYAWTAVDFAPRCIQSIVTQLKEPLIKLAIPTKSPGQMPPGQTPAPVFDSMWDWQKQLTVKISQCTPRIWLKNYSAVLVCTNNIVWLYVLIQRTHPSCRRQLGRQ